MDELYDEFIEKTDYLTETKGLLKDRINSLGGSITSGTTFRDYLVWLDSLYERLNEMTITGLPDSLEGKCEQNTTPSKNLYNANDTTYYGSCTYVSGANTNQYKVKATGTDVIINSQVASGSSYSSGAGTLIPCKYGETIYYDTGNSNFSKNFITQYNSSKVSLGFANIGSSSGSYTPTNSACEYISIRIGYGSATSGTEYTLAPIISKSSDLSYEPYTGPVPNPNNPRPINITTGRQVVSVVGKNRINNANLSYDYSNVSADKNTLTTIDTGIRYTTTSTGSPFIIFKLLNLSKYIGKVIRLKANFGNNGEIRIIRTNNNCSLRQVETQSVVSGNTISYTVPSDLGDKEYLAFGLVVVGGNSSVDFTNLILTIDDSDTTYEEYKGNDYEINLGKNLYYMNYTDFSHTWNGLTITSTTTGYSISNTATGGGDYTLVNRYMTLPAGTYTMVLENASSMVVGLSKNNYASILRIPIGSTSGTFTLSEETKVCLTLRAVNGTTYDETNNIMIEKGSVATSFTPYKTPIYLGEIGTYQDYIFRNTTENPLYDSNLEEGQWYIHQEIGRVVLNGSESWNANEVSSGGVNYKQYFISFTLGQRGNGYSNYFVANGNNIQVGNYFYINNSGTLMVFVHPSYNGSDITSTVDWKSWLGTHNTEVYYLLKTPTNTLIEDEELINQLNEIDIFTVISEDFYN